MNAGIPNHLPSRKHFMHTISIPQSAIERGHLVHPPKALNPLKTAVLAIDFQRFFIDQGQPMGNEHARDILDNANRLHAALRTAGALVIFTQHSMASAAADPSISPPKLSSHELSPGSSSYEIHPRIVRSAQDLTIVKYQSSPLHPRAGTNLADVLRARGIETLIITGLVTNGCCDCTARDAFQHGFEVVFASDATAAMTDEEHNAALLNLAIYYARVMDADAIEAVFV